MTSESGSKVIREAEFDQRYTGYIRILGCLYLVITVVGILLIPFWLVFSIWFAPESLRRLSARVTANSVEIKKGVYFRKEITIPLNRITDVRLHDGPLMRYYGIRGIRVETAGQAGQNAGSEGDLVGVVDAVAFRDAVLRQREIMVEGGQAAASAPAAVAPSDSASVLAEIRDILARIESKGGMIG